MRMKRQKKRKKRDSKKYFSSFPNSWSEAADWSAAVTPTMTSSAVRWNLIMGEREREIFLLSLCATAPPSTIVQNAFTLKKEKLQVTHFRNVCVCVFSFQAFSVL